VFDPPHAKRENGMEDLKGYITKTYGALHAETWQEDLRAGFEELWRILKPGGTLVFKFSDDAEDFEDVLSLAPREPLFGTTTKKSETTENRWFVFYKPEGTRMTDKTTIEVSKALRDRLKEERGPHESSYEDTVWRLLGEGKGVVSEDRVREIVRSEVRMEALE